MVDARGYLCPMPVVMVQEAIKKDQPAALDVLVDNETAVENIKRFVKTFCDAFAERETVFCGGFHAVCFQ